MRIRSIFCILILFFMIKCNSTETIEDVDFIGKDNKTYKSAKDPGSKKIIAEIVKTAPEFQSFKSDFSMKIQTFVPKPDTVYLEWKIFTQRWKTCKNPTDGQLFWAHFYGTYIQSNGNPN